MPNMNHVYLTGHVANEPELQYTQNGTGYTKFTLAVGREFQDETDFIRITCWNQGNYKLAEYVGQDVGKGDLVTVHGELHIDQQDERYYTSVNANKVIYNRKGEGGKRQTNNQSEGSPEEDDFDVPF